MLLDIGEKVHVIERRLFETDVRRHFVGVIERVEATSIRATGYFFVYDTGSTTFVRGNEQRTRVMPLATSDLIINVAPSETSLEDVRYVDENGRLIVTDGGAFRLDINEFGRLR